jgi:hypothetical protein
MEALQELLVRSAALPALHTNNGSSKKEHIYWTFIATVNIHKSIFIGY